MFSILIETRNDEERLAETLASLVGGAVEGAVREVIVCDRGSDDRTRAVGEHAGCKFETDDIASCIAGAKGEWLVLLEPGARLVDGWIEPATAHAAKSRLPARFSLARGSRKRFLSRLFRRQGALAQGLLISRERAAARAKSAKSAEAIARGLAMKTLTAEVQPPV